MIVPTLRVGMPQWTLRVRSWDAERPGLRSHAERGNDQSSSARTPSTCYGLVVTVLIVTRLNPKHYSRHIH
ncbi:hypothetical protein DJ480_05425 [Pseudomonas sp. Leaf98]|nr:hypothetical protein DJ480_05425 [Pseudomonas sp. Leaf98]